MANTNKNLFKFELAQQVGERLGRISGVVGVVIGGSLARGTASANSDIDLGIYYEPQHRPSISTLRTLAQELDDRHLENLVTDYGEWGPWINGGGWLVIHGQRMDWLYRDLSRVQHEIAECEAGRCVCHYQPGHPHGFYNHIYMGEIAICHILIDRGHILTTLKSRAGHYPPRLKQTLIRNLWEARFSVENAYKPAERADVITVMGHLYRAVSVMTQMLFALNEQYCINEKGAAKLVESFSVYPPEYSRRIGAIFGEAGTTPETLYKSVCGIQEIVTELEKLAR